MYMRSPSAHRPPLQREYHDLDLVVLRSAVAEVSNACSSVGFQADKRFNALHGASRLLFRQGELELDVFVQVFAQCHKLDFAGRLVDRADTVSLADLLLTKLQVVKITRKDITDSAALLLDHPLTSNADESGIVIPQFLDVVCQDWGWYTTVTDNLAIIQTAVRDILEAEERQAVADRCEQLLSVMQQAPKTLSWKLRARIGRRLPWYDLPEEKER